MVQSLRPTWLIFCFGWLNLTSPLIYFQFLAWDFLPVSRHRQPPHLFFSPPPSLSHLHPWIRHRFPVKTLAGSRKCQLWLGFSAASSLRRTWVWVARTGTWTTNFGLVGCSAVPCMLSNRHAAEGNLQRSKVTGGQPNLLAFGWFISQWGDVTLLQTIQRRGSRVTLYLSK